MLSGDGKFSAELCRLKIFWIFNGPIAGRKGGSARILQGRILTRIRSPPPLSLPWDKLAQKNKFRTVVDLFVPLLNRLFPFVLSVRNAFPSPGLHNHEHQCISTPMIGRRELSMHCCRPDQAIVVNSRSHTTCEDQQRDQPSPRALLLRACR